MSQLVLTNEERKDLFTRLSKGIDEAKMNLNEYVFASADLLRTMFWTSQTTNLNDEELKALGERMGRTVTGIVEVLDKNTDNVAEDIVALATVMMEAANHVIMKEREDKEEVPAE